MISTNLIKMGTLTHWHADALCADTDQCEEEKTKEKIYLSVEYRPVHAFVLRHALRVIVLHVLHVDMDGGEC